jgi:hypothetical protein
MNIWTNKCFYDNITYTPFIHTDEDFSQTTIRPRKSSSFGRNSKDLVDPYALMLEGRLNLIRPSLASVLKLEDCYGFPNVPSKERYLQIRKEFDQGPRLQLTSQRSRPEAFLAPDTNLDSGHGLPGVVDIKVVKIGILFKREPKRMLYSKSSWKEWGAILTASQFYLFKDVSWIKSAILSQPNCRKNSESSDEDSSPEGEGVIKASIDGFHPSSVLSTVDMAALFSGNLETSQQHTFLLAGRGGAQEVFAASTQDEMEDWMLKINYASAFNTYHIGIQGSAAADSLDRPKKNGSLHKRSSTSSMSTKSSKSQSVSQGFDKNGAAHSIRVWAVDNQLQEIHRKWEILEEQLKEHIRNGDHLKLLAPIQQRTRESVIFSAGKLAAKLDWHWRDRKRLLCYQNMFQTEKEVETELCNCSEYGLVPKEDLVPSISSTTSLSRKVDEEQDDEDGDTTLTQFEELQSEEIVEEVQRDLGESIASSAESLNSIPTNGEEITVKPVATNELELPNTDGTLKVPKKGFHQRSLRSGPSKKERHQAQVPEQHRSASLVRKDDGGFTLHGKKFSVVQVNPEFAANPTHQRTASQHLAQILDKSKGKNDSEEQSQATTNQDAKADDDTPASNEQPKLETSHVPTQNTIHGTI